MEFCLSYYNLLKGIYFFSSKSGKTENVVEKSVSPRTVYVTFERREEGGEMLKHFLAQHYCWAQISPVDLCMRFRKFYRF